MRLNLNSLAADACQWRNADVILPEYNIREMRILTKESPSWVHFGAGNIFRGYIASLENQLLNIGVNNKGIIAVDSSRGDQIKMVYRPFDNLTILVSLQPDGTTRKEIVASVAEAVHADWSSDEQIAKLRNIFRYPGLQICSFTITEKGYAIPKTENERIDLPSSIMAKTTALLYERFKYGAYPIALVSMDNCSRNGEILRDAVMKLANLWLRKGEVEPAFFKWLSDENCVSFPWTMIDKITPRPNEEISRQLTALGIEKMKILYRKNGPPVAPFVNCEASGYLVIEDHFPNGRPSLEKVGVFMVDRDTVSKTERMKVTACLNPIHTALAVLGCLLGYRHIYEEMKDEDLRRLVEILGFDEGMPVVTNPGIINPNSFLNEVLNERLPNPYIPDTPQRIACDTSQKMPVRFGETIKSYLFSDSHDISKLRAVPFVIAAWLRYLSAEDDSGKPMHLSEDPRLKELQHKLEKDIDEILSDESIFGADLTDTLLYEKITAYYIRMKSGPGAVRDTLHLLVNTVPA